MYGNHPDIPRFLRRRTVAARLEEQIGLTLIEVVIYLVVMVLLFGPIASVFLTSIRSNEETDIFNKVAERSRVALHRIAEEVRPALRGTIQVGASGQSLEMSLPDGYDGTAIIPGPRIRFELLLAPDEQKNGADDNGNGLIDEGQLVRRNLVTGEAFAICQGIDLTESRFEVNGDEVNVTIVNGARMPDGESMYTLDRTMAIKPRN